MGERNENGLGCGEKRNGFLCSSCEQWHDDLPLAYSAPAPALYDQIPTAERDSRVELTSDVCVIDGESFFVLGNVEIPILDSLEQFFVWGLWVSLSEENFRRTRELWESPERTQESPYFGWLSNAVPGYPNTLNLKTNLHTRELGVRPFIELEPTDHPLAIEQRNGISMSRVASIAEAVLHGNE